MFFTRGDILSLFLYLSFLGLSFVPFSLFIPYSKMCMYGVLFKHLTSFFIILDPFISLMIWLRGLP